MPFFEIDMRVYRPRKGDVEVTWYLWSTTQSWYSTSLKRVPKRRFGEFTVNDESSFPTPEVDLGYLGGTQFINVCTIEKDSVIEAVYLAQRATRAWILLLEGASNG